MIAYKILLRRFYGFKLHTEKLFEFFKFKLKWFTKHFTAFNER